MKKNQTYKTKNYDFSDYAEEITGDALFKINGGAQVENSDKGVAGAKPGDTITRENGDVIVIKQIDIDIANEKLGNTENSEGGNTSNSSNTNNSSSGTNNTGTTNTPTSESTPEVPEEIKSNPYAYAAYMALQAQAKAEGEPDRYKGYNVLGIQIKELQSTKSVIEANQPYIKEKIDWLKEIDDVFDLDLVPYTGFSLSVDNLIEISLKFNLFSHYNNNPYLWSSSLEATLQLGSSNAPLLKCGGKWEKIAGGETPLSLLEYGYEYEFTPVVELNTRGKYDFEIDGLFLQTSFYTDEYFDLVNKTNSAIYDTIKNWGKK